ncbi:SH3 domain-containing protein [Leptospira idonii]|uniref:SH3 domain-containing protein n=1 Tax=Leptospira idonii TaxID=1193500 RepID=A0A4R9LYD0_9LEPT|nr:SH3 domain-containing protein [Leptospira idonii]TGN19310.1 SH3 domain-containing protein [Leptospira idonii]
MLTKIQNVILCCFLFLSTLCNCKSSSVGFGYSSHNQVNVLEKPLHNGQVIYEINKNEYFDIIQYDVEENSKTPFKWHKVRRSGSNSSGYIHQDQTVSTNKTQIFLPVTKDNYGLVIASKLMLRQYPDAKSSVLEQLNTKSIVNILDEGKSQVFVDGKLSYWLRVKTKNNLIGFVFSPYIVPGVSEEFLLSLSEFESPETGWAYVNKSPKHVYQKVNGKLKSQGNDEIQEGEFYRFKSRFLASNGEIYLRLVKEEAKTPDWYADTEVETIFSYYIPIKYLKSSSRYALLYSSVSNSNAQTKKMIELMDRQNREDFDIDKTQINSFVHAGKRIYVITTEFMNKYDSCIGFFCSSPKWVYVFSEDGELLFHRSSASEEDITFTNSNGKYRITTLEVTPPEGDKPAGIKTYDKFVFDGKTFVFEN